MKPPHAFLCCSIVLLAVLLAPVVQAGGNADATFDRLFGEDYKAAKKSREKTDDIALAAKLLDSAKTLNSEPELKLLLLEKTAEMGEADPGGYGATAEALVLLSELDTKNSLKHYTELITLHEKYLREVDDSGKNALVDSYYDHLIRLVALQISKGNSILAKRQLTKGERQAKSSDNSEKQEEFRTIAKIAMARGKVERDRKRLASSILRDPSNQANVKALTEILLLSYDQVKEAQAYAKYVKDADLKKHIEMANTKPEQLKAEDLKKLADWYFSHLKDDKEMKYFAAMDRTEQLYSFYLSNSKPSGINAIEAKKNLNWLKTHNESVPDTILLALKGQKFDLASTVASPFPTAEPGAIAEAPKGPNVRDDFYWVTAYSIYKTMISEGGKTPRTRQNWLTKEVVGTMLSHDAYIDTRRGNAYLSRDLAAVFYMGEMMRVSVSVEFKRGVQVPPKNRLVKVDGKITRATFVQMKRTNKVYLRVWIVDADWTPTDMSRSSSVQSKASREKTE